MDKNSEIWKTFVGYQELIGSEGKNIGLDLFGSDQIGSMALSLTQTHYINELRKEVQSLFKQDSELGRGC